MTEPYLAMQLERIGTPLRAVPREVRPGDPAK